MKRLIKVLGILVLFLTALTVGCGEDLVGPSALVESTAMEPVQSTSALAGATASQVDLVTICHLHDNNTGIVINVSGQSFSVAHIRHGDCPTVAALREMCTCL